MWKMWKGIRELESLQQAQSQGSLGEVGIDVLDEHGGEAGQVSARSLPAVNMELPLGPSQLCQGVVPVELDPLRSAWDGYGGAGGCACCLAGQDSLGRVWGWSQVARMAWGGCGDGAWWPGWPGEGVGMEPGGQDGLGRVWGWSLAGQDGL